MTPALMPSSSACEPRVAETWVWLISLRLIGRAPICRVVARSWASVDAREAAGDLGALAAVDPVRVLREVDDRPGLDFVVEDDREVTRERFRFFAGHRADRRRLAALGDLAGDFLERLAAVVGEVEGDVRFVEFAVFLLRVGDVGARERRVVLERVPARLGGFVDLAGFVARVFGDDDRAGRHFDDDAVFGRFSPVGLT